ncbi:MAG: hypothetical protein GX418_04410 [Clostridiales bacterium]|nr:hypothetical protein [Clostridiales bacterium]
MKTVLKDNRVEQIDDAALPEAVKRGWREVDPISGLPITTVERAAQNQLTQENERLRKANAELTSKLDAAEKAAEKTRRKAADKAE